MTEKIEAKVTHHFQATEERIFDAWVDEATLRAWMGLHIEGYMPGEVERVELDPHVGGRYHFSMQMPEGKMEAWGSYLALERPHKLSFSWLTSSDAQDEHSVVTVVILPHPDGGSVVTLTHEMAAQRAGRLQEIESGWTIMLRQIEALLLAAQV